MTSALKRRVEKLDGKSSDTDVPFPDGPLKGMTPAQLRRFIYMPKRKGLPLEQEPMTDAEFEYVMYGAGSPPSIDD